MSKVGVWSGAAAAAVAIMVGVWYVDQPAQNEAASFGPRNQPTIPVGVGTVELRDIPVTVRGLGTVQAFNSVAIKSRVDGQITKVGFVEGAEVKAGDLLFEIDPRPYQAALELARANKEKDEAQLQSAQADLARYTRLLGTGFQTRQGYDQQTAMVGQIQAAIKGDQAQIDNASLNLDYAEIRSPIDGRTGARQVDIGNLVHAADATPLVTVTQIRPVYVSFTVAQENLEAIRAGQASAPLDVRAYSSDGKTVLGDGKISLIDNAIDPTTGTIHLKAVFDNAATLLWPGQFINAELTVAIRKNVPTVPAQTMQQNAQGAYVYVVQPDLTVRRRMVVVAATANGLSVISKGLNAGERVVVDGQYRLNDGSKIQPQAPAPAAPADDQPGT